MAEDDFSKTEDPTPRKLARGRDEGQVAQSQEIKSWMMLLGATFAAVVMAPSVMKDVSAIGRTYVFEAHSIPADFAHLRLVLWNLLGELTLTLGPLIGLFVVLALAANIGQSGLLFAPKKLRPKLEKISLRSGFKRLFSFRALNEFLKGILKLVVVSAVAFGLAVPMMSDVELIPSREIIGTLERLNAVALALIGGTVAVMTVIAILDFAYQKYAFFKQMRMTKQEVKDEHKQTEGDPLVRSRIRKLRVERAQRRMMAAVPQADVVVTNPSHYAVALEYKMELMVAPKVVAKGIDSLAHRIRAVAEEHDVPVVENPPLARALYAAVELDQEIPPEHYKAVAEVIGFVMRLRSELPPANAETGAMDG
jgi:flagellar biosynthetic protein FlhB